MCHTCYSDKFTSANCIYNLIQNDVRQLMQRTASFTTSRAAINDDDRMENDGTCTHTHTHTHTHNSEIGGIFLTKP